MYMSVPVTSTGTAGGDSMARGRRAVGRMEKLQSQGPLTISAGTGDISTFQFDGGEVEAQVKRIMLSFGAEGGTLCVFKLGLFQKQPTTSGDFDEETVVISGSIGNQCWHNETITMRVPEGWYVALLMEQLDASNTSQLAYSLQLNYKVLN